MGSLPSEQDSHHADTTAFSIAIIGGGIGGLSLAIGLLQHPHIDVQVYESAHSFGEIGAGITVGPNTQRALALLGGGAEEAFNKLATSNLWTSHANIYTEYRIGIAGPDEGKVIATQRNSSGMKSVHRAKFLDQLVKLVPASRSHFGKRLVRIDDGTNDGGRIVMHFKDGTTAEADAVIGCDGIHSATRAHVLGPDHPATQPVFTNNVSHRTLVPMNRAIEKLGEEIAQNTIMMLAHGCAVFTYPVNFGEHCCVVIMDLDCPEWKHDKWIVPTTREKLDDLVKEFGQAGKAMAELLDGPDRLAWAIWDSPPAPFYNKGRVVVMGDAAHATSPWQGQGAGQAIEDALALKTLLGVVKTAAELPAAFWTFDQVRRPRTQAMVATSREAAKLYGLKLPGVGADWEKIGQKIDTRMRWLWNLDHAEQNRSALRLFAEATSPT